MTAASGDGSPESIGRFVAIDEHECWALLETVPIGRLAVPAGDQAPSVFPIAFTVDDWVIVFRTGPGEKLLASLRGPISFQADSYDPLRRTGWSVLVKGIAYEVGVEERDGIELEPWAPGRRDTWLRLVPLDVSGRRIEHDVSDLDGRGYV